MLKRFFPIPIFIFLAGMMMNQTDRPAEEAKGLAVGQPAPLFTALDADSNMFRLEDALVKGPVVMIFYRGHWCPVCNKHLGQVQDSLRFILKMGATVIAVSPEKPEYLGLMADKADVKFTLLFDENYRISDSYDVAFKPSSREMFTYNVFLGAKMKKAHSDNSQRLPIPATYIISSEGNIAWRHFDPDYKNRSSVYDILQVLGELTP